MREVDEGRASLKALQGADQFEVAYRIVFTTELHTVRSGFPPVTKMKADVEYIRSADGRAIPEGEYLLERPTEINRVKNLGFGAWHVLSWPIG
jgi:hypothetical protein